MMSASHGYLYNFFLQKICTWTPNLPVNCFLLAHPPVSTLCIVPCLKQLIFCSLFFCHTDLFLPNIFQQISVQCDGHVTAWSVSPRGWRPNQVASLPRRSARWSAKSVLLCCIVWDVYFLMTQLVHLASLRFRDYASSPYEITLRMEMKWCSASWKFTQPKWSCLPGQYSHRDGNNVVYEACQSSHVPTNICLVLLLFACLWNILGRHQLHFMSLSSFNSQYGIQRNIVRKKKNQMQHLKNRC